VSLTATVANSKAAKPKRKGLFGRLFRALVAFVLIFGFIGPVLVTALYRFVPPPLTYLMVERAFEGRGFDRRWRSLDDISPRLVRAVIAAEDARFCNHHGFDFTAIEKALKNNKRRPNKIRGGSTISQQTAKNVFLWQQRSYVRKGLEAYFTVLIELMWGKTRIMEVYLNSIEWGPGIYGAEAAAQRNFGVSAKNLSATQAARLAAILPSPLKWRAAKPGPYVKKRSGRIRAGAGTVREGGSAACVLG
jgi:monofunctional biosynthetic peptidoglycan transglycosylase